MSIPVGLALHPAHLISELKTRRMDSVLGEICRQAQRAGAAFAPELLRSTLLLRERLGSTAVGRGVAVPNARSLLVLAPVVLVGRSRVGLDWGSRDGEPVRLVLLVLSPAGTRAAVHGASVARAVVAAHPARARQRLLECAPDEAAALLRGVLA
jgi:mannitol/fructose-specific phosphotransferase system IIA component (Ntr-type)